MVAENATGQSKKLSETEKGGGKSIKFVNGLFMTNSDLNVSRLSLWGVLKIYYSAPKFHSSRCYTISLTVFFHLSVGVTEVLSMGLSDHYNSFLWTNFSYL